MERKPSLKLERRQKKRSYHTRLVFSYAILAPAVAKKEEDPQKASKGILEVIALESELFRLGATKAC